MSSTDMSLNVFALHTPANELTSSSIFKFNYKRHYFYKVTRGLHHATSKPIRL